MRKAIAVAAVLGSIALVASCKKTVEGESASWQRNTQHVQELSALYPGFAGALKTQLQQAESAMQAAQSISDKEASAKKMAEANSLVSGGFISTLGQLDSSSRRLREKMVTASTAAEHAGDQLGAKAATEDAQRVLRNLDDALKAGAPDPASATAVLRKLDGDLASASANLERVVQSAKQRQAAAAAPAAAGAAAAPGAAGAAAPGAPVKGPVAAKTWKCKYCGQVNDDGAKKCPNCGAPHP
jgi:hypothetical protein